MCEIEIGRIQQIGISMYRKITLKTGMWSIVKQNPLLYISYAEMFPA